MKKTAVFIAAFVVLLTLGGLAWVAVTDPAVPQQETTELIPNERFYE